MTPDPISVRSDEDIALVAPLMLGYWPDLSVCVVVVDAQDRVLLIMRWHVDAPEVPPHLPLADATEAAASHVIVFCDGREPDATPWARIADEIAGRGIALGRLLFVERRGESISVAVGGAAAEGVVRPTKTRVEPADIARVRARWGLTGWAQSREAYIADIAPDPTLIARVSITLGDTAPLDEPGRDRAIGDVRETLSRGPLTPESIAGVLVALADIRVRDTVLWELMHSGVESWSDAADSLARVVSGSPDEYVAPPATVLAILRWQLGDGSRAAAAVERALEVDPGYSLADLINRCLLAGLHPGIWAEGVVDLTRESCRRSA